MKKTIMLVVWVLLLPYVFAEFDGFGTQDDPYRWKDSIIGVTEDCTLSVYDSSSSDWISGSFPGMPNVIGSGSQNDPYRIDGSAKGLMCIPEPYTSPEIIIKFFDSTTNSWIDAPTTTKGGATSGSSTPTTPPVSSIITTSTSGDSKQIDLIWQSIRGKLGFAAGSDQATKIWNPPDTRWVFFDSVYASAPADGSSTVPPSTSPSPSTIPGAPSTIPGGPSTTPAPAGRTADPPPGTTAERYKWIYDTYRSEIDTASSKYSVDKELIIALIYVESSGKWDAVSPTGAAGIMQFVPGTFLDQGGKVAFRNLVVPDGLNSASYKAFMNAGDYWKSCPLTEAPAYSPCNKCNLAECDYVNDQRFNPQISIDFGVKELKRLGADTNEKNALKSYHGGDESVKEKYANGILVRKAQVTAVLGAAASGAPLPGLPPTTTTPGSKEEIMVKYGLSPNRLYFDYNNHVQLDDASTEVISFLQCMQNKLTTKAAMRISSISDSNGLKCWDTYTRQCSDTVTTSCCAHLKTSAHYGCSGRNDKSWAVDFGDEEYTCEIAQAAKDCGINKVPVTYQLRVLGPPIKAQECPSLVRGDKGHTKHVHVSMNIANQCV
jgi:hypothetical protein